MLTTDDNSAIAATGKINAAVCIGTTDKKPMHKILEILISSIESNFMQYVGRSFCNPKKAIIELTGPIAYTRAVHKYVELHSANGIKQLGIDFEGAGVFSMKGSGARYLLTPNYAKLENSPILI